jgi:hypothetical protein
MTNLDHRANAGMHPYGERGLDNYGTPPIAGRKLLEVEGEQMRGMVVAAPAAGTGQGIVLPLRAAGLTVIASDVADYGCPACEIVDFFTMKTAPRGAKIAVFNPPFIRAAEFIRHALTLFPLVISLGRLAFLESEARSDLIDDGPLARVHVFRRRLPMMHRRNWQGPKSTSSVAFAWFTFERDHRGSITIDRI